MKYKLEFVPNPQIICIHFQKQIAPKLELFQTLKSKIFVWENNRIIGEKDPQLFVKRIWEVVGVTYVSIDRYSISIGKGHAFEWKDLVEQIIAILNIELFPNDDPELIGVEQSAQLDEESVLRLREMGCEVQHSEEID